MRTLNSEELKSLYFNFVSYRDMKCNGNARMSVREFYEKYGLESCGGYQCTTKD